jgi:hypothetical protein
MFLASSLNDKLKKTMNEVDPEQVKTCLFPYEKPPTNGAVITIHKHDPNSKLDSDQLFNLSKEEWEKTFTIPKLHNKWKEKINVNFNPSFKKISDDVMPKKVREAKLYIKDSVDPDNLELKKNKRWNNSVNPNEKIRPELKKTIFEATHKLNNYRVVPLKEKKIEEGTDSRNYMYINGEKWNNSTLFEDYEKQFLNTISGENAFENTKRYWRATAYDRLNENIIPISNNRRHFEEPRFYKKYLTPLQNTNYKLQTMRKVKEITSLERERILKKVIQENPASCEEKINLLTNKQMYNTYQEKFNELTGKSKSLTQKNFFKKDWKDEELVDKVKTLNNWKNIKWFKPFKGENDYNDKNFKRRELLKPLVTKGCAIAKEEDNIKTKLEEEYKKEIKKKLLQKRNKTILSIEPISTKNSLLESKYPLDKKEYEIQVKKSIEDKKNYKRNKSNDNIKEIDESKENDFIIQDDNAIIPVTQPYSNKYFLQAYKTVTLDDLKEKKRKRKNDQWIEYQYSHFGTYREFEFTDKIYTDIEIGKFKTKKEKIKAWSCCMNTDEFSKGCRKIRINKLKWNLDNA